MPDLKRQATQMQTLNPDTWYRVEAYMHGSIARLTLDTNDEIIWNAAPEVSGEVGAYFFQSDVVIDELIFAYGMEPGTSSADFNSVESYCP
jgi:hypothetical protein